MTPDLIESRHGSVPIEITLNSTVTQRDLTGLKIFLGDVNTNYAILINRGKRIELLTDKIIQIPVNYI